MTRPRKYTARLKRPSVSVRATTYAALQAAAARAGDTPASIVEQLLSTWLDAEAGTS